MKQNLKKTNKILKLVKKILNFNKKKYNQEED